jgi:hypothetical protein
MIRIPPRQGSFSSVCSGTRWELVAVCSSVTHGNMILVEFLGVPILFVNEGGFAAYMWSRNLRPGQFGHSTDAAPTFERSTDSREFA